ncbi:MAG: cytidine deaminase [Eubacteriales bacterium]|nr:cytidine deaminase [Eubacteriales bacterium]
MKLLFEFENARHIDFNLLQRVADACQLQQGIIKNLYLHVILCNNEQIRSLNFTHRGIDKATDVLSFPSMEYTQGTLKDNLHLLPEVYDSEQNAYFLGDTIISIPKAQEQAEVYGHSLQREVAFLLTHSILHLFGYDHIHAEEEIVMLHQQEDILNSLNIKRTEDGSVRDETLVSFAIQAMNNSYSPYSKFPVGACLLTKDGNLYTGCNIENAAFGSTMCAERTAVFKAVSEGHTEFEAIAIAGKDIKPYPCGSCRQVLNEFAPNIRVLITDDKGNYQSTTLDAILPYGFGPKQLNRGKNE